MTRLSLILVMLIMALASSVASAQQTAQEQTTRLRAQLADLQARETDLQMRLAQIDEDIKPENIERSLAGVGSVHPEELREARRRQLNIQRQGVQSQLDSLAVTRAHLEAAIAAAEAESYRQTIGASPNSMSNPPGKSIKHGHRQKHRLKRHGTKKT